MFQVKPSKITLSADDLNEYEKAKESWPSPIQSAGDVRQPLSRVSDHKQAVHARLGITPDKK